MAILNPYLAFRDGAARGAMEFYQSVFGGELTVSTFGEFQPEMAEDEADYVMHAQLTTPSGFTLMGSDTPSSMPARPEGSSITISLSGSETEELRGYWDKLADGGEVTLPLEQAPWGDWFGQLTDRYGTAWMVNIAGEPRPTEV